MTLFHFSTPDGVTRPQRSADYRSKFFDQESLPIVIDNGSYHCRVGYDGSGEPRLCEENLHCCPSCCVAIHSFLSSFFLVVMHPSRRRQSSFPMCSHPPHNRTRNLNFRPRRRRVWNQTHRWACEEEPRINFRNVVSKPRCKSNGQFYNVVGDYDSNLVKTFDVSRSTFKSPFDSNVVYHLENMETIFDYTFERLGIESESSVPHPILCTECPFNPSYCRNKMAELFFEVYGVKSLAFGIDSIFSYLFNRKKSKSKSKSNSNLFLNGLLLSSAHSSSHIIPVIQGEPYLNAMCQLPVGGFHITDYLKKILSLKSNIVAQNLTWEKTEQIVHRHCYVAEDYALELKSFQGDSDKSRTRTWQLPFTSPTTTEASVSTTAASPAADSLQEKAKADRRQLFREQAAKRFREMAAERKAAKIEDLQNQILALELILKNYEKMEESEDDEQKERFWSDSGFSGKKDVETRISHLTILLKKAKGEMTEKEEKELKEDARMSEQKFYLLHIPDNQLTPDELKEKRKQRLLKNSSEGRARARMRKEEEKLKAEKEKQDEEERRRADPEAYLAELKSKYTDLQARAEQRKKQRCSTVTATPSGLPSDIALTSGSGSVPSSSTPPHAPLSGRGKGERLTSAQRERMKLLTSALYEKKGKRNSKGEEDTFGMNDEDWLLYRKMSKHGEDAEDEEIDEVEKELAILESKLQEMDPSFISHEKVHGKGSSETMLPLAQLTEADFQVPVGIERVRATEILFRPSMVGLDQAGIGEMLQVVLRRLPSPALAEAAASGDVFLTGGCVLLPGFTRRLEGEYRRIRPIGSEFRLVTASEPLLDAWHGASYFARSGWMMKQAVTREEYEERGFECLRKFRLSYGIGL